MGSITHQSGGHIFVPAISFPVKCCRQGARIPFTILFLITAQYPLCFLVLPSHFLAQYPLTTNTAEHEKKITISLLLNLQHFMQEKRSLLQCQRQISNCAIINLLFSPSPSHRSSTKYGIKVTESTKKIRIKMN